MRETHLNKKRYIFCLCVCVSMMRLGFLQAQMDNFATC